MALAQAQGVVVEAPVERGQGAAVGDARLSGQGAGGLARGRGPHHLIAGGFEAVSDRPQGCRLARAGDSDNQLDAPPGGEDGIYRGPLAGS